MRKTEPVGFSVQTVTSARKMKGGRVVKGVTWLDFMLPVAFPVSRGSPGHMVHLNVRSNAQKPSSNFCQVSFNNASGVHSSSFSVTPPQATCCFTWTRGRAWPRIPSTCSCPSVCLLARATALSPRLNSPPGGATVRGGKLEDAGPARWRLRAKASVRRNLEYGSRPAGNRGDLWFHCDRPQI